MVHNSSVGDETKIHLYQINRRRLWFKKEHDIFSSEELFLARKIFKHILSKHNKPSFGYANMLLNANVAELTKSNKPDSEFDYWIKFSTLEKGNPIMLPLKSNEYFDSIEGKLQNAIQFNLSEEGKLSVRLMKELKKQPIEFRTEKIAADIGLKNLLTLSTGDVFGRNFYVRLKHYDEILTELMTNRQKQGLPVKSRRYNLLVRRIRAWIKNEVRRMLNRVVELHAPKKIAIEALDFRGQNLSKWMNRLLCKFGKREIINKLESLKQLHGIEYQEVPAPYTSQTCPNTECGYVAKNNRPTQEKFVCKCCGYTRNADNVGSKNILVRSSDEELSNVYLSQQKILQTLVMRFLERQSRHRSLANSLLLSGNPYFKGYLEKLKQVA
jgi:putative transposase